MEINEIIPKKLLDLIDKSDYSGHVRNAFREIIPILENQNSALFFFPEFTDHGSKHIKNILDVSVTLISKNAFLKFTPNDAVLLVTSTLLHDVAMMLTSDGLMALLEFKNTYKIDKLDRQSWCELFDSFYLDAKHWDDKKLHQILGDKDSTNLRENLKNDVIHIKDRPNSEEWSIRYRKFLGEFVRLHHARLAHEIAIWGYPSNDEKTRIKLSGYSKEMANLCGIVARSHNMALRSTLDYLEEEFDGSSTILESHPIYVMVLLRVADYIQLKSDRVNNSWQSIQRLRSPISNLEWNAHLSIKDIRQHEKDPESLFVYTDPEDIQTFLKIKKIVSGLQQELDTSWAVLSEVYGRIDELKNLDITLRRIRSSIDDEKVFFGKRPKKYYPFAGKFDTINANILHLLIRPLYGNNPGIGVRELLQNSLDSVREARQYLNNHSEHKEFSFAAQNADVLISILQNEDSSQYLVISDKGIGMTAETVRDYFLKAGASFRNSSDWRKEFKIDNESTILRTGRFGIGVLAAFLLGDRIEVETRHITSSPEFGVKFEARIDDELIEINRISLSNVGTTIKIHLNKVASDFFLESPRGYEWNWYVLDDPKVEMKNGDEDIDGFNILEIDDAVCKKWHSIYPANYQEVKWNYLKQLSIDLVCNGIIISNSGLYASRNRTLSWGDLSEEIPFRVPTILVFDNNSQLPLTIQRDRLETSEIPFANALVEDVTKSHCAMILFNTDILDSEVLTMASNLSYWYLKPDRRYEKNDYFSKFISTRERFTLLHPWHIKQEKIRHVLFSSENLDRLLNSEPTSNKIEWTGRLNGVYSISDFSNFIEEIRQFDNYFAVGARVLLVHSEKSSNGQDLSFSWNNRYHGFYDFIGINNGKSGHLFKFGEVSSEDNIVKEAYAPYKNNFNTLFIVVEVFFNPEKLNFKDSPFTQVWSEVMKKSSIPFDGKLRQAEFSDAIAILKDYME